MTNQTWKIISFLIDTDVEVAVTSVHTIMLNMKRRREPTFKHQNVRMATQLIFVKINLISLE